MPKIDLTENEIVTLITACNESERETWTGGTEGAAHVERLEAIRNRLKGLIHPSQWPKEYW